jgi:chromosome condensin MukBEF MukE localization factor
MQIPQINSYLLIFYKTTKVQLINIPNSFFYNLNNFFNCA